MDLLAAGPSIHNALRTEASAMQLPLAIHLSVVGDWLRAGELVPAVATGGDRLVMSDVIMCSEAWATVRSGRGARGPGRRATRRP